MAGLFRTSDPFLNEKTFQGQVALGEAMTLQGTVNKTGLLLLCVVATAAWTWGLSYSQTPEAAIPWMIGGLLGGFVTALVTIFRRSWAPFTAPIYALLEGLALGGISAMLEQRYPRIAIQAVSLTFGVLFVMLLAYSWRIIRVTETYRRVIFGAVGGICLLYIVDIGLQYFNRPISFIHESGPWGIAFSIFVTIIAALNLANKFDLIETGVRSGAPKYMEWYGAFGVMVTLIWLYLEILRLLGKMRRR
jgi:uncharacterized YccA/Bax inhibitor family protein